MKLIRLSIIVVMVAMLLSCSKTINAEMEESVTKDANEMYFTKASYSDDVLSFANLEEMNTMASELALLTEQQYNEWRLQNNNFTSLIYIYEKAIDDIQDINDLQTLQKYKEFYSASLLFNDDISDDELYNPYLPINDIILSSVANWEGAVLVAGKRINLNDIYIM